MLALAAVLKIYFEMFLSSEPEDQLIQNFIGSIEETCRSKAAKIGLIGYPRWLPWQPS